MDEDSFYLPCPSNSSMKIFPDNTLAAFTVNLETALELSSDYEVGLCELQYPQSWDNIRKGNNAFQIAYRLPRGREVTDTREVPPGYYEKIPDVIRAIKNSYSATRRKNMSLLGLEMEYNPSTRRVNVNTMKMKLSIKRLDGREQEKAADASIMLKDDIARLLGFRNGTIIETGKDITSEFAATPSGGFHQMYLYTDIIEPQPHPDAYVQILRTIAVEESSDRLYKCLPFQKVYYMALQKHYINSISFQILDDTEKKVGFDYGKVVPILHFRKRR